jgi:predicted RNA binding protein YcfA (HicA-like mRNA interferase family)
MAIKQIPLDKFVKWLESLGLEYIRSSSSHDYYNYPERHPKRLTRPITVRTRYKDIPILHIHTNLKTLGVSKSDFEKAIKNF